MKKEIQESPMVLPNKEELEVFKDALKHSIAEEIANTGTFDLEKISQKITEELPDIDELLLGPKLKIFKDDMDHYAEGLKPIMTNKDEFSQALAKKVDSSLDFLLPFS